MPRRSSPTTGRPWCSGFSGRVMHWSVRAHQTGCVMAEHSLRVSVLVTMTPQSRIFQATALVPRPCIPLSRIAFRR